MCTVTLEYNKNNALARRKLAALLATGLFYQVNSQEPTSEEVEAHRQLRDAVLEHSRKSMSHVIAREEYAKGETISCHTPEEMQKYFDSL